MGKNVLVSGGAGYIGSHACKALKAAGFCPVTYDNLSTGWEESVKFGPFEHGDLLDAERLDAVFTQYSPIAVMHFAAVSLVGESMKDPAKYWRNNLGGSLNLCEAAQRANCKNIVFSSTCATYGEQDNLVLDESAQQIPNTAYGTSKYAVEQLLKDFEAAFGLKHVIFRYFNVAGADPDGEIGEFHQPETHLIPLILDAIAGKRDRLTVFGADYDTEDGTCIRDYVHVCDLVDAHVLGLKWLIDGQKSRVFNLGTGSGFSVKQVIETAQNVTQKKVPFSVGNRREGDCTKLVSGSVRASKELGWTPQHSSLEKMIADAWNWHQKGHYSK